MSNGRAGKLAAGVVDQEVDLAELRDRRRRRARRLLPACARSSPARGSAGRALRCRARSSARLSALRLAMIRSAPRPANASAISRPMPRPPPVTSAVRPANRFGAKVDSGAISMDIPEPDERDDGTPSASLGDDARRRCRCVDRVRDLGDRRCADRSAAARADDAANATRAEGDGCVHGGVQRARHRARGPTRCCIRTSGSPAAPSRRFPIAPRSSPPITSTS